jgi:hypothetical protein
VGGRRIRPRGLKRFVGVGGIEARGDAHPFALRSIDVRRVSLFIGCRLPSSASGTVTLRV